MDWTGQARLPHHTAVFVSWQTDSSADRTMIPSYPQDGLQRACQTIRGLQCPCHPWLSPIGPRKGTAAKHAEIFRAKICNANGRE